MYIIINTIVKVNKITKSQKNEFFILKKKKNFIFCDLIISNFHSFLNILTLKNNLTLKKNEFFFTFCIHNKNYLSVFIYKSYEIYFLYFFLCFN